MEKTLEKFDLKNALTEEASQEANLSIFGAIGFDIALFENNIYPWLDANVDNNCGSIFYWVHHKGAVMLMSDDTTKVKIQNPNNWSEEDTVVEFKTAVIIANLMISNMISWHFNEKMENATEPELKALYEEKKDTWVNIYHANRAFVFESCGLEKTELSNLLQVID
ncbi:hypothetical protein A6E01_19545 (plasmid) [Vibrio breoganii]|uniref:Immunity protein 63 domain-containing protein n=1 Tax=Vibrio breoganii TaxID=553239 RepID=A0AAN0XZR0_9VIBR|nr:hypothetical protein [Vibrio breoganii]ANO35409.1 hypothetical protein A6E01_19545 [Vibrio breoganii]